MADSPLKPPLQKPPGYRDPNSPSQPVHNYHPPPPHHLPPSFRPNKKHRCNCFRTCYCIFFILFLFLIVVVSLSAALFYLLFDPKLPVFHLQSFRISQFTVSVKPDGSYLDAQSVIRVEFKNPNDKLSIFYGRIGYDVTIGEDTELGRRFIDGFIQGSRNTTSLKAEASVKNKLLDDDDGLEIMGMFRSKEMMVKVEAQTTVGVVVQGWRIGPVAVNLECDTKLKTLDGGGMPKCKINLMRWFNIY